MLTDHDQQTAPPPCRHRWVFVCWYRDPITRTESSIPDFRHMIERCARCAMARVSTWFDQTRMNGNTYAESVEEAVLGKPYSLELAGMNAKVAAN